MDTTDIYIEALKNQSFVVLFLLWIMVLSISNDWALTTKKYIGRQTRRNYFAETFLSFIHAFITSITCMCQLYFNTKFTRKIYSYSASLSCAYFVFHGFKYLSFDSSTNIIYILHHLFAFLSVVPITNINAYYLQDNGEYYNVIYFVSAGLHAVEISTIWLDIRIFSKLWQKKRFYFVSTLLLVITYFPLRCIWLGYLMYVIMQYSNVFNGCFGHYALTLLLSTFGFIWLMSFAYSIIMLKSGKKLFKLEYYNENC
eukprot:512479_1